MLMLGLCVMSVVVCGWRVTDIRVVWVLLSVVVCVIWILCVR